MPRKATTAAARRRAANQRGNQLLPNSNTRTTDEWIRADELTVDLTFERPYNARRAKKIANDLDPDALGVLYVSRRSNGENVILDGQHRRGAFMELGWGDQKMPCHVYHGLSRADEARLFCEYNELRTKPRPIDLFRSRVVAGDEEACAIAKLLADRGLEVSWGGKHGTIGAVQALTALYRNAGKRITGETLDVALQSWGMASTSFQGEVLTAIGVLLARYAGRLDRRRLVRRLSTHDPTTLLTQARLLKQADLATVSSSHGGARAASYVARQLIGIYNSGLRAESRLEWRERSGSAFWMPENDAR